MLLGLVLFSYLSMAQVKLPSYSGAGTKGKRQNNQIRSVPLLARAPVVDGKVDAVWSKAAGPFALDQNWIGAMPLPNDFEGSFKVLATKDSLYILAAIVDDTLMDGRPDPLDKYWDDDCLEIFLDPDASGGPHECSHNAWAYHIALDGRVVDYGPDCKPHLYNHVFSRRHTERLDYGTKTIWEVALALHKDVSGADSLLWPAQTILSGKRVGFALAYCDNDYSRERENFMGSVSVPGKDKNQGYKNAWIFGLLEFKKPKAKL